MIYDLKTENKKGGGGGGRNSRRVGGDRSEGPWGEEEEGERVSEMRHK